MASDEQRTGSSILLGALAGLAMGCIAGGAGAWVVKSRMVEKASEWLLVPVVVAAVDIDEETVVTFDMISQRSVPQRFATKSVVKPDSASYVVNQKVHAPLKAGDPLLWSEFENNPCNDAVEAAAKSKPGSKNLAVWAAQFKAKKSPP
ncbi:MAG: SAF domain-containing protein [Myxococcaceae bacterium]